MASACFQEDMSFSCPVCLELLRDPVAIPCGHNFCMRCINGCWDQEDLKGKYSCPVCKHNFCPRPMLHRNPLITEMVDKFKSTRLQASDHCYAGPEHVDCDVCPRRKLKAVKSCLDCLKSYCEMHLKSHNEHVKRPHTMIDPTAQLQERICPRHNKVLDIFCRTDQSCICYFCVMEDHKGHDTVIAAAEWSLKKEGLAQKQDRCHQIIQLKEKELLDLRKAVETLKTAEEDSDKLLAEIEQEIAEVKRTEAEMKQLAMTQDPIYFLKNIVSIPDDTYNTVWTSKTFRFFQPMQKSVSALNRQLEEKLDLIVKQEEDHDPPVRKADSKEWMPPKSK
ncbi:E3 ubiquitin-protein ligase TRIM47-like [Engraulis encrasicolus]|uniref:E3 ubiquitin-protein ligase TRIM47-like n=1 Tax=Engraulis encrasicolus TaxID=184585 RepID=UPI002FCF95BE